MSTQRSPGSIAALLTAVALFASTGCGGRAEADTPTVDESPLLVGPENMHVADSVSLQSGPSVSGTLVPEREATVRAELGGRLIQVRVEDGQPVRRGQLMAKITDDGVRDQLQSAQSAVRTATEAAVVARRNAERSERLAANGAVAERDLEQARWTVTNAEGALDDAKARLASAQKQWSYTQLRAPIRGVVSERKVNVGDVVTAGAELFTIVDPSSLRLEAQVPVAALERLEIGTEVPFQVDGYGTRRFDGRIKRINPAVDPATRQVRVIIGLPNQSGRLVAGLFAQGRAAIELRHGVAIPTAAVDRRNLFPTVARIRNGAVERVEVTLGLEDAALEMIEITNGLAVGDTVLTGSVRGLQPGTRVAPAAAAERQAAGHDGRAR